MAVIEAATSAVRATGDEPASWTETTRLLSAAAYLESTFAQEAVDELAEESYRAVQAPEGVDPEPVLRHCLAACRHKNIRDALLASLLGLAVVALALGTVPLVLLCAVAAWAVVLWDIWTSSRSVVLGQLTAATFQPDQAPEVTDPQVGQRIKALAARKAGNVTVYSGFNPFIGAGFDHGGWSFAMDMRKGADRLGHRAEAKPFALPELYGAISESVAGLEVEGLEIEDRLFVNGVDVRYDPALLPDIVGRPVNAVSEDELARFVAHPTHRVRHYKCVRVIDWRGELVVSMFLRFALENGRLFAELSRFLLPPLKPNFRRVDGIDPELSLRDVLAMLGRASAATLALWLRSPASVIRPLRRARHRARELRRVKRDPLFDYGAPATALDRARSTQYSRYFQKLDREMYVKVLERTILDSLVEFLDARDIDTTELSERRETIINNGIMVPGGSVEAHNVAVGQGANIVSRLLSSGNASAPQAGAKGS